MKMKKKNITLTLLTVSSLTFAQVGINTANPAATLDITAKNPTGTSVEGLLVVRVDRLKAQSMTGIPTSTMIYVNSVANGSLGGNAVNIDAVGYYYYNGSVWVKLHNPGNTTDTNIYNTNGTLTGNRTVTQGSNTLAFTANSTNAFSVNGNNFSVDALNRRVGIGTAAPSSFLSLLNPVAGNVTDILSAGIDNCGAPCSQGTPRSVTLYNSNATNPLFGGIEFIPSTSPSGITGASIIGIDRDAANNYAGLQVFTRNATDYAARMTIKSSGNVGIGTAVPATKLDVQSAGTPAVPVAAIKIVDGNQSNGYVLTSDAAGVGTWKAIPATSSVNIYNTDGTLTGNRAVTQGSNTLAFTGTAVNAFSVDGTTLSVDAANDRVGVGTAAPTNRLHINGTDPLRLQGTTTGNTTTDPLMVLDANGVVKTIGTLGALSIPNPALFRLETAQTDFLNGFAAGSLSIVPMTAIKNSISGMSYNAATSTITFPAGTYQITFVYEALHNNDNGTTVEADKCRNSSYIVDFPTGAAGTQRIHSTAYHNSGILSNHGGTITYSTTVPAGRTWPIRLGRGQSGNCSGTGMTLAAASTQLLVFRIGD